MELGYARVSTQRQDLERQQHALRERGIPDERIYLDKKSGATIKRPGFEELLAYARDGDTIVTYTFDRLGRNLRECLNVVHDLRQSGIGVMTLADPLPIDTSNDSPMGNMAVALLGLFAEMERVFANERAAHAREVARAQGRHVGRPKKLDEKKLTAARAAVEAGQSVSEVAAAFGVNRATLYRHLAAASNEPGQAER